MAYLLFPDLPGTPPYVQLTATGPMVAGRAPDCTILLPDAQCSRRHFAIERGEGGYILTDLGSANGTLLNGLRLQGQALLTEDDRIRIGTLELHYVEELPANEGLKVLHQFNVDAPFAQGAAQSFLSRHNQDLGGMDAAPAVDASKDRSAFSILTQLSRILLNTTTRTELLESVVDMTFQALRVHRAAIYLVNEQNQLILRNHRALDPDAKGFVAASAVLERAMQEKAAILSRDPLHDPRTLSGSTPPGRSECTVLALPLWNEQDVYGVLYLDNLDQRNAFSDRDLELASGIANLLALGVKQHKLQEKVALEAVQRSNLARYHSPDVVELILGRSGVEAATQTVAEREATVLFSDIVGFTPLSERLRTSELAELLNWYFDLMTKIIFRHKGSVNKFIGDAIMAIFGAPISHGENGDDAIFAVRAAQEMVAALEDFNAHLDERKRFQIRIGVNTGSVIAGDIGARNRMEYTVIGDAVNTAQRIESICRPNAVTVGPRTFELVRSHFAFHDLGEKALKGKAAALRVYEVAS